VTGSTRREVLQGGAGVAAASLLGGLWQEADAAAAAPTGRFWRWDVEGLRPDRPHRLRLLDGRGRHLAEPWEVSTFPAPQARPRHLRLLIYTCAGGNDVLRKAGYDGTRAGRARRRSTRSSTSTRSSCRRSEADAFASANRLGVVTSRKVPGLEGSQLVEEAYRTWNRGGPRAFAEFTTEQVELHDVPELPDAQTWVGHDAVVARLEEVAAATGGRWADIEDIQPIADEVLVSLTWRLDRASTATLASVYHVVRVEGDKIARVRVFLDEGAATRAALGGRGG
jgi:hypothetical protein